MGYSCKDPITIELHITGALVILYIESAFAYSSHLYLYSLAEHCCIVQCNTLPTTVRALLFGHSEFRNGNNKPPLCLRHKSFTGRNVESTASL